MNKRIRTIFRNNRGVVLITVLITGMIITFVAMSLADLAMAQYRRTVNNVYHANAMLAAEAGIERTLNELNIYNDFTGYDIEQEFYNDQSQGRGTYESSVTSGEGAERVLIATGRAYRHGEDGELMSTRSVKVTLVGTTSVGYSVYTGVGGLILGGSANITNSEIFINGRLEMSGNAKIGTYNNPVNVSIANVACPLGPNPGPSFPQGCSSTDGNPISAGSNNEIFGTVCATHQSPSGNIKPGNGGEGLQVGCVAPPIDMPEYDRETHIDRMTTVSPSTSSSYTCAGGSGVRDWPANLRLDGDVELNKSCEIVIHGDTYITGDLLIGGNVKITVAEDVGETRPYVVVDGEISVSGSSRIFPNSSGTGIHFISFQSEADCGADCIDVTGTDLSASMQTETIGIRGAVNLPGMLFQSYWGKIYVGGSGNIGAALGQTVDLRGSGNITFGTSLSSGHFTWTIRSYQQIYNP